MQPCASANSQIPLFSIAFLNEPLSACDPVLDRLRGSSNKKRYRHKKIIDKTAMISQSERKPYVFANGLNKFIASIDPNAEKVPQIPVAIPLLLSLNQKLIKTIPTIIIIEKEIPSMALEINNDQKLFEKAPQIFPIAKQPIKPTNNFLGPKRVTNAPPGIAKKIPDTVKIDINHETIERLIAKSAPSSF